MLLEYFNNHSNLQECYLVDSHFEYFTLSGDLKNCFGVTICKNQSIVFEEINDDIESFTKQ